jgi:hypothetical protein
MRVRCKQGEFKKKIAKNKEMECGICYFFLESSEFFPLQCCKNNNVCLHCIELLTTPLCPFCRARIPNLDDKRLAISHSPAPSNTLSLNLYSINPYDDAYIDSRSLRRQMKRIRKLQERERDIAYSRYMSSVTRHNRTQKKQELDAQIKEERDIFDMEM